MQGKSFSSSLYCLFWVFRGYSCWLRGEECPSLPRSMYSISLPFKPQELLLTLCSELELASLLVARPESEAPVVLSFVDSDLTLYTEEAGTSFISVRIWPEMLRLMSCRTYYVINPQNQTYVKEKYPSKTHYSVKVGRIETMQESGMPLEIAQQ